MSTSPLELILKILAKYGLILILIYLSGLMFPDFSPKTAVMELDLDFENDKRSSSSIFRQLVLLMLSGAYILLFFKSKSAIHFLKSQSKFIALMTCIAGLCILSSLWSNYPDLTLKRTVVQICLFVILLGSIYFSIRHNTFNQCIKIFLILFIGAALYSIALGTGWASGGGLAGWDSSKNNFGALCFFMLFLLTLSYQYRSATAGIKIRLSLSNKEFILFLAYFIPLYSLLILSLSKTSIALSLLFFLSLLLRRFLLKKIIILTGLLTAGIFLVPALFDTVFGQTLNIGLFISEETLTGRGMIWSILYSEFSHTDKLLLGAGYSTYFNTGTIPDALSIPNSFLQYLNSAHNGYLELALQFGIPLATVIIFILILLVRTTTLRACLIMCWLCFIYNVTESAFLRDQQTMWIAFLFALAYNSCFDYFQNRISPASSETKTY